MVLVDAYGRPLKDLRFSVTPECNLDCFFCHMEGLTSRGPVRPGMYSKMGGELLYPEDYRLVGIAARELGVSSFKLTGGEPLIREDIAEITRALSETGCEVSMTTNGTLLERKAHELAGAGLSRVNVSIHGLSREIYEKILGRPTLDQALRGVRAALEAGLRVKINYVLVHRLNEGEFWKILDLAEDWGVDVQVIELHPAGRGAKVAREYRAPLRVIEEGLLKASVRVLRGRLHNRRVYELGSGVRVHIVDPVDNPHFCEGCYRLRVSWDGSLLPCIYWKGRRPSLLPALRSGGSVEEKLAKIKEALVEANRLRRPTYFYGVGRDAQPRSLTGRLRISVPRARPPGS